MSQVRKYQSGGNTPAQEPPKPKVGRFTMNGRSLEGQKAVDKILAAYRNTSDTEMGNMAVRAIQDGYEAKYNPLNNSIQIVDESGNDITKNYLAKGITAKVTDSAFRRNWGATFGTKNDSFRRSGLALKTINMEPEKVEEPDNRTDVRFGSRDFIFDEKSGAYQDRFENTDSLQRLEELRKYFSGARADQDKLYKASHSNLNEIWNYADEWVPQRWDNLIAHIKAGKASVTDEDRSMLNLLGFIGEQQPQEPPKQESPAQRAAAALNPGNESMFQSMGITSTVGEDGRTHITGKYHDRDLSQGTWLLTGDYNWFGPEYKWLHNGILYKGGEEQDKTNNYDLFNAVNAWYQNKGTTSQGWWDSAKASGVHFSGEEGDNPFMDFDNSAYYDTEHNGAINEYIARSVEEGGLGNPAHLALGNFTGSFDNVPEGTSIYGYVNPENRDAYGTMGDIKFFSIDGNGTIQNWNQPYGARPMINPNGMSGFSSRDEENGNNFVYHRFNFGNDGTENTILTTSTLNTPERKYFLKGNNRELDPSKIAELMQAIKEGKITGYKGLESYYLRGNTNKKAERAKAVTSMANSGTSFYMRRKEGGVIETPKLQYGGGINGSNNKIVVDNTAEHTIDKAHQVGKGAKDGGLTQAEKLQIAGAIGDLAGVGVSFVPVAGAIAGAATGAAASTTRFIGDIKQDGFQGKDLGNYLLNLGLDATSLFVPAVGKTAKGAKALKTIKGLAEPIMMALAVGGATQAAGVMKKIIADEKVTSKDMVDLFQGLSRTVLGGATTVKVGKEAKVLAKESAKNANKVLSEVKTVGGTNIKKTNQELQDIVSTYKTKTKVAEQLGLTPEQTEAGLKQLGIKVQGRTLTHPFANKERVELTTQIPTSHAAIRYFNNPFIRNSGLDALAQSTTSSQLAAANRMLSNGSTNSRAQVLARLSVERPWMFKDGMFTTGTGWWRPFKEPATSFNRWTLGGRRWIRLPQQPKATTPTGRTVLEDASWATYREPSGLLIRRVHASYYLDKNGILRMAPLTYMKEGGLIPKLQNGGNPGSKWIPKLSPLLDLGSAVAQSLSIGRSYDLQRQANAEMKKRQIQAPQLIQQRLDLSPIEHKYQLAEEPLRKFKNISSDNMVNMAGNLSVAEKLSSLGMQKGAEMSDYIDRFNQQYVATENQQRQLDTQAANERSAYLTNLNARDYLLDSQEINDKWANVWNTYSQQFRQGIRDSENKIAEANYNRELQKRQSDYEKAKEAALMDTDLYKKYSAAKAADKNIGSFDSWITSSTDNYNAYNDLMKTDTFTNLYNSFQDDFNRLISKYAWRMSLRKGGKLRPTNEEIAIQGDKSAKRAVVKMNDHLMKMLIKLM